MPAIALSVAPTMFSYNDFLVNHHSPSLPNSSTPRAAKMKKRRKNSRPRLPTCGKACITVSSRARIPFAIFRSFKTVRQNNNKIKAMDENVSTEQCFTCLRLLLTDLLTD
jgi:hypothetical protein